MDFEFRTTPEMEEFRQEVRRWLNDNVPADLDTPVDQLTLRYDQFKRNKELRGKIGEKGWYAPQWPKEYGGGGLKPELAVVLEEELVSRIKNLGTFMIEGDIGFSAAAALLHMGSEEQRQRFLPSILKGRNIVWELFTEPNAGSDLPSMTTQAVRDGDEYVLNGTKTFVAAIHESDYMFTLAVTNPDQPRHNNLGAFMIPSDTPGITVHSLDLIGGGGKRTIFLENVRVPLNNLIGREGEGWRAFTGPHPVSPSLIIDREQLMEKFLDYVKEITHDGMPITNAPETQSAVVDVYLGNRVHQLLGKRNYWIGVTNQRFTYQGQQYGLDRKLYGPKLAKAMLQTLGPSALIKDDPKWAAMDNEAEWYTRQAVVRGHPGGTVEVHKLRMWRGYIGNTMFER